MQRFLCIFGLCYKKKSRKEIREEWKRRRLEMQPPDESGNTAKSSQHQPSTDEESHITPLPGKQFDPKETKETRGAKKIQAIARGFLARKRAVRLWESVMEEADTHWLQVYLLYEEEKRRRRLAELARKEFTIQYVQDVIATSVQYVEDAWEASTTIQRMWRGYYCRAHLPPRPIPIRPVYKRKIKPRHSRATLRRVWARREYEPSDSNYLHNTDFGYVEYDMWQHADQPPQGRYPIGLVTRKIKLPVRSNEALAALLHDRHAWVGLPINFTDKATRVARAQARRPDVVKQMYEDSPYIQPLLSPEARKPPSKSHDLSKHKDDQVGLLRQLGYDPAAEATKGEPALGTKTYDASTGAHIVYRGAGQWKRVSSGEVIKPGGIVGEKDFPTNTLHSLSLAPNQSDLLTATQPQLTILRSGHLSVTNPSLNPTVMANQSAISSKQSLFLREHYSLFARTFALQEELLSFHRHRNKGAHGDDEEDSIVGGMGKAGNGSRMIGVSGGIRTGIARGGGAGTLLSQDSTTTHNSNDTDDLKDLQSLSLSQPHFSSGKSKRRLRDDSSLNSATTNSTPVTIGSALKHAIRTPLPPPRPTSSRFSQSHAQESESFVQANLPKLRTLLNQLCPPQQQTYSLSYPTRYSHKLLRYTPDLVGNSNISDSASVGSRKSKKSTLAQDRSGLWRDDIKGKLDGSYLLGRATLLTDFQRKLLDDDPMQQPLTLYEHQMSQAQQQLQQPYGTDNSADLVIDTSLTDMALATNETTNVNGTDRYAPGEDMMAEVWTRRVYHPKPPILSRVAQAWKKQNLASRQSGHGSYYKYDYTWIPQPLVHNAVNKRFFDLTTTTSTSSAARSTRERSRTHFVEKMSGSVSYSEAATRKKYSYRDEMIANQPHNRAYAQRQAWLQVVEETDGADGDHEISPRPTDESRSGVVVGSGSGVVSGMSASISASEARSGSLLDEEPDDSVTFLSSLTSFHHLNDSNQNASSRIGGSTKSPNPNWTPGQRLEESVSHSSSRVSGSEGFTGGRHRAQSLHLNQSVSFAEFRADVVAKAGTKAGSQWLSGPKTRSQSSTNLTKYQNTLRHRKFKYHPINTLPRARPAKIVPKYSSSSSPDSSPDAKKRQANLHASKYGGMSSTLGGDDSDESEESQELFDRVEENDENSDGNFDETEPEPLHPYPWH